MLNPLANAAKFLFPQAKAKKDVGPITFEKVQGKDNHHMGRFTPSPLQTLKHDLFSGINTNGGQNGE
jgi:hypothetical protein